VEEFIHQAEQLNGRVAVVASTSLPGKLEVAARCRFKKILHVDFPN